MMPIAGTTSESKTPGVGGRSDATVGRFRLGRGSWVKRSEHGLEKLPLGT